MYFTPNVLTFKADAAISQGMAVKFGTDKEHVAKGSANTSDCIGICLTTGVTTAEDLVEVAIPGGGGEALLGGSVSMGQELVSHTDGSLVVAQAAGDKVIAIAMEDGVSGDIISVQVVRFAAYAAE